MKKLLIILSLLLSLSLISCSSLIEETGDILSDFPFTSSSVKEEKEEEKETETIWTKGREEEKGPDVSSKEEEKKEEKEEKGTLSIQFIDVGQADAALVECEGQYLLIDGGNRADSDILYAITKRKEIKTLDYIVGTHAHEDHIGGIAGAIEACDSIGTVYCPVTDYESKAFANFVNAVEKKGSSITAPTAGDTFALGGAEVKFLGPVKDYDNTNNTSLVLKITYGKTSFLFTGDMERDAEIDLLESGADVSADVLKVGHHGSESSTSYRFLREVAPEYGIISVGKGNSYGHPHEETLSRLRDADVTVYRTDESGDIFCTTDGETVVFEITKKS